MDQQRGSRRSADTEIVRALACRYARALDRLDADLLRSCFHDDAEIEMGEIYRGPPDGFVPVAMEFMGGMQATRHVVSNVLDLGGGYECYVDAWHLLGSDVACRELIVRGRYLQVAAEREGRWALTRHSEIVDFGCERAVDAGWCEGPIGLPRGLRGRDDESYRLALIGAV